MLVKSILIPFLMLFASVLYGQDIRTAHLSWPVTQLQDLRTNATANYSCVFETQGAGQLLWKQKAFTTTFTVQNISGTWENIQTEGKSVFDVAAEGLSGTLTFERTASGTTIVLDLTEPGGERIDHRYQVSDIITTN